MLCSVLILPNPAIMYFMIICILSTLKYKHTGMQPSAH